MEHSLSSLAFGGPIIEAITQAKQQKKLFVVYISGDNPESNNLQTSTWTDSRVAESVSKYCVLLHISEGSTDATNFSALYPQKPAPCITAVGHNGVQVWQSEGFVTADFLATSIEKAWLSLQIQETTATFLTASLASKTEFGPGTSTSASLDQGGSSDRNVPSPSTDRTVLSREAGLPGNSEILEEKVDHNHVVEERNSKTEDKASPESVVPDKLESDEIDEFASRAETAKELSVSASVDPNEGEYTNKNESSNFGDHDVPVTSKDFEEVADESKEALENVEVEEADVSHYIGKSNDVHLNIRLPDGSSLQVKFSVMDTLAMVKDYVDKNRTSGFGSYDLAIPYPRKVFDDHDLDKQLSELGLSNRQALIVVLRHHATSRPRGILTSHNQTNTNSCDGSPNVNNEGYWAFVKRMMSYINPLSYLGGGPSSSSSVQETQSGVWQYEPNPSLQNDIRDTGRPYTVYSPNQATTGASSSNNSRSKQQTPPRFGSNIHTLKHDEDDSRFSGRNAFWNGNSTQFGGDNDGKK